MENELVTLKMSELFKLMDAQTQLAQFLLRHQLKQVTPEFIKEAEKSSGEAYMVIVRLSK